MSDGFREAFEALEQEVSDIRQRLDTLQTPLWKRIWFRVDGWPGQRDLNADRPRWRPWRRWYTSCLAVAFLLPQNTGWVLEEWDRQPVEQQDYITNPTACVWDFDDMEEWRLSGDLAGTTEISSCIVEDWITHHARLTLIARSADIQVTLALGAETVTAVPVKLQHDYRYEVCLTSRQWDNNDPRLGPVGDGVGEIVDVTARITNPGRRVRGVVATFSIGQVAC